MENKLLMIVGECKTNKNMPNVMHGEWSRYLILFILESVKDERSTDHTVYIGNRVMGKWITIVSDMINHAAVFRYSS